MNKHLSLDPRLDLSADELPDPTGLSIRAAYYGPSMVVEPTAQANRWIVAPHSADRTHPYLGPLQVLLGHEMWVSATERRVRTALAEAIAKFEGLPIVNGVRWTWRSDGETLHGYRFQLVGDGGTYGRAYTVPGVDPCDDVRLLDGSLRTLAIGMVHVYREWRAGTHGLSDAQQVGDS